MVESEEGLAADLAEAKEAYRADPDDDKAKAWLDNAKRALVEARRSRRDLEGTAGVVIGGDAVQGSGN